VSSSPERHTFQANSYVSRCEKKGEEPREDYLNLFKSFREQDQENMSNPEWQQNNMEYDLRSTNWILEKARTRESYAQNLYAAMCNMQWQKTEVMPILKDELWTCSWRAAGGIVAELRDEGDYLDWYCSGMGGLSYDPDEGRKEGYVPESAVTDEIRADLFRLGWQVIDDSQD
jgi:hypothetical protein